MINRNIGGISYSNFEFSLPSACFKTCLFGKNKTCKWLIKPNPRSFEPSTFATLICPIISLFQLVISKSLKVIAGFLLHVLWLHRIFRCISTPANRSNLKAGLFWHSIYAYSAGLHIIIMTSVIEVCYPSKLTRWH